MILCLWCYHPTYRGLLLLDAKFGKFIDLAYEKIFPPAKPVINILGIPERAASAAEAKKTD